MAEPDVSKKKKGKKRRSARVYVNANKPLAVPLDEIAAHFPADPDDDGPTPQHTEARSRTRAMARPDTGKGTMTDSRFPDGDPMNPPGPKALALGHPDMQLATTRVQPLLTMVTVNGDNEFHDRDITLGGGRVSMSRLDAAAATGLASAAGNPASRRLDHIAPGSATGPNGSHGLADPQSHAVALKASDRVEIMRQAMYGNRAQ